MHPRLKTFVIQTLRRASYRWSERDIAKKRARVLAKDHPEINDLGRTKYLYKCEICGKLCKEKEKDVDHLDSVEPVNGYKNGEEFDANEFIERLFCPAEKLQIICKICHHEKTQKENEERRTYKKGRKNGKEKTE